MKVINEKTLIPIGLALSVIGGGSKWLTTMYERQEKLGDDVKEFKQEVKAEFTAVSSQLRTLQDGVAEMRGELKRMRRYSANVDRMTRQLLALQAKQVASVEISGTREPGPTPRLSPIPYSSVEYQIGF
jgi:hypothetical protein